MTISNVEKPNEGFMPKEEALKDANETNMNDSGPEKINFLSEDDKIGLFNRIEDKRDELTPKSPDNTMTLGDTANPIKLSKEILED
jgi:hypothetical protein